MGLSHHIHRGIVACTVLTKLDEARCCPSIHFLGPRQGNLAVNSEYDILLVSQDESHITRSLPPGSGEPTWRAAAAHFTYRASQVAVIDFCSPKIPGQILCVTGEEIQGRAVGVTKRSQEQRGAMRHAFYHASPSLRTSTESHEEGSQASLPKLTLLC